MRNCSVSPIILVVLSLTLLLDIGICQSESKKEGKQKQNWRAEWGNWAKTMGNGAPTKDSGENGGKQNWRNGWRNWANTYMNNGPLGASGSGNPWLQIADKFMANWMNNGNNQPGGFYANLKDGINKKRKEKKSKTKELVN